MTNEYPSQLLERAINEFSKLPGIGKKTAMRLALHLLRQEDNTVAAFTGAINQMKAEVKYCKQCHNISDSELCPICASQNRDHGTICVVETVRDVMAIEQTLQYHGVYHVLGGVISPMDGIGPNDLQIASLVERVQDEEVKEVVLALSSTMEGDTTNFYIFRKIAAFKVTISALARGISVGDELQYADEITLGRSIINRTAFDGKAI